MSRDRELIARLVFPALPPDDLKVLALTTLGIPTNRREETMEIKRRGSQPSAKGQAEYFTGEVRIDPLFQRSLG